MRVNRIVPCCTLAVALTVCACDRGPDISEDPAVVGQTVTLTGEVEELYGPTLVKLDTGRGDLIVVTGAVTPSLKAGDRVTVTGDIRRLTVAEFERDFALDLDPDLEVEFENENFLAAREIKPV